MQSDSRRAGRCGRRSSPIRCLCRGAAEPRSDGRQPRRQHLRLRLMTRGVRSACPSTFMLSGTRTSRSDMRNRLSIMHRLHRPCGCAARSRCRMSASSDSSRTSIRIGSRLSLIRIAASCLDQLALLHAIRNLGHDRDPGAAALDHARHRPARARRGTSRDPWHVGSVRISSRRIDDQPAGRQIRPLHELPAWRRYPLRRARRSGGSRHRCISATLCGGMLVAIPTAIPARAIGQQIGEQAGKNFRLFLLAIIGRACNRTHAVIEPSPSGPQSRPASAAPRYNDRPPALSPSIFPKLPCPSTSGYRSAKSLGEADHCVVNRLITVRMIFSDRTSPTTRAHFLYPCAGSSFSSRIAQRRRL